MALSLWYTNVSSLTLLQNTHHIRWLLKHCWILTFLGHYRIWCILLFQLSVCHAKPHVWQSSKHLKKMAEKIQKKNFFPNFFRNKQFVWWKNKQQPAAVVAKWAQNGKIMQKNNVCTCSCMITSKPKINVFWNFFEWIGPEGASGVKKKFQNTLILVFEVIRATT